jgi:hypothetical protein
VKSSFGHKAQALTANSPQRVYLFHGVLPLFLQRMIGRNFRP